MRVFEHFLLIISLAAGTLLIAQVPATDPAANVVLAATREALGGDKKLSAVKTIVATGRTRQVRGENLVPIEFEIAIELPDKYVRKDEIPAQESDPTTVGFNGEELIQFPVPAPPTTMPQRAGGPPAPTAASLEAARKTRLVNVKQDFARLTLGMFAGSFPSFPMTFSYVAKAEAPQGKADVLEVKGPANFTARLFVNAETHLPVMVTWTPPAPPQRGGPPQRGSGAPGEPAPGAAPPSPGRPSSPATPPATARPAPPSAAGQPPSPGGPPPAAAGREGQPGARGPAAGPPSPPPESRIYYADYRDVNGMQFPFRLRRAVGPDTIEETTFDGFKINTKIDAKKFEVRK
jgi:hypothetical protein